MNAKNSEFKKDLQKFLSSLSPQDAKEIQSYIAESEDHREILQLALDHFASHGKLKEFEAILVLWGAHVGFSYHDQICADLETAYENGHSSLIFKAIEMGLLPHDCQAFHDRCIEADDAEMISVLINHHVNNNTDFYDSSKEVERAFRIAFKSKAVNCLAYLEENFKHHLKYEDEETRNNFLQLLNWESLPKAKAIRLAVIFERPGLVERIAFSAKDDSERKKLLSDVWPHVSSLKMAQFIIQIGAPTDKIGPDQVSLTYLGARKQSPNLFRLGIEVGHSPFQKFSKKGSAFTRLLKSAKSSVTIDDCLKAVKGPLPTDEATELLKWCEQNQVPVRTLGRWNQQGFVSRKNPTYKMVILHLKRCRDLKVSQRDQKRKADLIETSIKHWESTGEIDWSQLKSKTGFDPFARHELSFLTRVACNSTNAGERLKELATKGYNINLEDESGRNLLMHIYRSRQPLDHLYISGIDLHHRDREGDTILHYYVRHKDWWNVFAFLRQGGKADIKNNAGLTALELAIKMGDDRVLEQFGLKAS